MYESKSWHDHPHCAGFPRRHQAQVRGAADFSCVDETSFLEGRQMLFDRHEMGGSMTGRRGRIDVITDQKVLPGE